MCYIRGGINKFFDWGWLLASTAPARGNEKRKVWAEMATPAHDAEVKALMTVLYRTLIFVARWIRKRYQIDN